MNVFLVVFLIFSSDPCERVVSLWTLTLYFELIDPALYHYLRRTLRYKRTRSDLHYLDAYAGHTSIPYKLLQLLYHPRHWQFDERRSENHLGKVPGAVFDHLETRNDARTIYRHR
jgi:hypothetical protein